MIVPFTRTSGAFAAAPGDSARMSAMREISVASAQAAGIRANNAVAMAIPEKSQRQSMAQPADLQDAGKALLPAWGSKWEDMGTSRVNRLTCNRQTRRATSCLSRLAGYFQENSPVSFFLTLFGPRTEHDPRHKDGAETGLGVVV